MVTPHIPIDVDQAGLDDSGSIFVEGALPAGRAVSLVPRRYRKQPDWWVIDVIGTAAPGAGVQQFRLCCAADGLWGREGIEIKGAGAAVRIVSPSTA